MTTCAWIDTSSAETGSSATISFGLQGQRAGHPDALALAAGELVREAVVVLGVETDVSSSSRTRASRPPGGLMPLISIGPPMILPTVCRGFSEEYGSWKIIWISERIGASSLAARRG